VIVVDSSVWISHFYNVLHPEVQILRSIIAAETILMGELIFLEVSMGAKSEKNARYLEQSLGQFTSTTMLERSTVEAAGLNYRRLRAQGITPRNAVDLIIGTYCIEHGHQLLHRDREFDQMQQLGLQVYGG
jgi:predicted nucleic acid-binding protein